MCVTPVHNRKTLTLQCLRSLFDSRLDGIGLHAIVVDDGSTDGTAEAIRREFPQVEVIPGDGNLWYTEGTNRGIEAAMSRGPDYVVTYNDDSIFVPDALQHLIACAEKFPQSIVGPALVDWSDRNLLMQIGAQWSARYGGWHTPTRQTLADLPDGPFPVQAIVGNCVLLPADAIRQGGLLNSQAMPNFGDAEYTPRLRRLGWRLLIEPKAQVLCQPNTPPARLSSMSLGSLKDALWSNPYSSHNIRLRHATIQGGAPNKIAGVVAFVVYLARMALRYIGLAGRWPNDWPERPLRTEMPPLIADTETAKAHGASILYCWPYPGWGGAQTYFVHAMALARANGFAIHVLVPDSTSRALRTMLATHADTVTFFQGEYDLDDARTIRRRVQRRWRTYRARAAIAAAIETYGDRTIVHIDAGPWSSYSLLKRILTKHSVIVTLHTALPPVSAWRTNLWRMRFRSLLKNPKFRLVAANGDMRKSLVRYIRPDQLERVLISPSCFNRDDIDAALRATIDRASLEAKLTLDHAAFRIVIGAQFIERKGYMDLLAALRVLADAGNPVSCAWIAPAMPPPEVASILNKPEYAGLLRLVTQAETGGTALSYFTAIARLGNVFVMPSHLEGLPLAVVEAMALGLPCIATDINGTPEAVADLRNGLLVPPRDPKSLAAAIVRLRDDAELRQRMGRQARIDALAKFERHNALAPTLQIYRSLA